MDFSIAQSPGSLPFDPGFRNECILENRGDGVGTGQRRYRRSHTARHRAVRCVEYAFGGLSWGVQRSLSCDSMIGEISPECDSKCIQRTSNTPDRTFGVLFTCREYTLG